MLNTERPAFLGINQSITLVPQCAFRHILLYPLQVMFPYDWLCIHLLALGHVLAWRDGACAMRLNSLVRPSPGNEAYQ